MKTEFTIDYFIKKFESIHEGFWCVGAYHDKNKSCALGHCGSNVGAYEPIIPEVLALKEILSPLGMLVSEINDGVLGSAYLGDSPKERILNALYQVKIDMSKS